MDGAGWLHALVRADRCLARSDAAHRAARLADLHSEGNHHGGRDLAVNAPAANGARPVAISAEGVSKHYRLGELHNLRRTVKRVLRRPLNGDGGLEALSEVDFTVYRGESFGIVGTNGSGKSTVLQILAGTTLPTGGMLEVTGRILPLLAVGTGFHPELTGRENVMLFASSLGIPRNSIESRMDRVGEFAEIERHMDTPVKRFSSGMISRLSFAIAMQFPADIYVFDEVLATYEVAHAGVES